MNFYHQPSSKLWKLMCMRCIDICSDAAVLVSSGRGVTLSYLKKKASFFFIKKRLFKKQKLSQGTCVFVCFLFLFFVFCFLLEMLLKNCYFFVNVCVSVVHFPFSLPFFLRGLRDGGLLVRGFIFTVRRDQSG